MWNLITWHVSPKTGPPWRSDRQCLSRRQNKGPIFTILVIQVDNYLKNILLLRPSQKVPVRRWNGLPVYHLPWLTTKHVKKIASVWWVVEYRDGLRCQLQLVNTHKIYLDNMPSEFQTFRQFFSIQMNGKCIDWIHQKPFFNFRPLRETP